MYPMTATSEPWMLALRGIFGVIFGVLLLVWPGITVFAVVLFFGIYVFVYGIVALITGIGRRQWQHIAIGAVGIVAGLITLFWPGITALLALYFIVAWAIVTGVLLIVTAARPAVGIPGWLCVVAGIVSLIFGLYVIAFPSEGVLALIWAIGLYSIVFGVVQLIAAITSAAETPTRAAV
ncbi:MAG: DUF308 domain-containing protein [Chloroflexi bacterium]|nr:DUF308 domain-containing protein [Chloroflexota bacterium]